MKSNKLTKIMIYQLILVGFLIFFKIYTAITGIPDSSQNMRNIQRIQENTNKKSYAFAVVGNIQNSIDIFDDKIAKELEKQKVDFIISAGNGIKKGSDQYYRLFNRTIQKLSIPMVVGIGEGEVAEEGVGRFYEHFGPPCFSFDLGESYFIFLDTTGKTPYEWQTNWLKEELEKSLSYSYRFVIMQQSPIEKGEKYKSGKVEKIKYKIETWADLFAKYEPSIVFTSPFQLFEEEQIGPTHYFMTGGGGGKLVDKEEKSFYHYIKVEVGPEQILCEVVPVSTSFLGWIPQKVKNIWIVLQTTIYSYWLDILFILSWLGLFITVLYYAFTKEVDYYPDLEEEDWILPPGSQLNIAMFTNNYFPFVGGVPISIERLAEGLRRQGHRVYIFAPLYPEPYHQEHSDTMRYKLLRYLRRAEFNLPIINIFSPKIEKDFKELNIDVIHVHHPFWMGTKGLRLGKKYKIPVILTYHTRYEKYAHNVPVIGPIFKNMLPHYMVKRFAKKCDGVFAPTDTAKEYLRNLGINRYIQVLSTGIDFDTYEQIPTETIEKIHDKYKQGVEFLFCSVARLTQEKNLYFLLEGLEYLKKNMKTSFRCMVIGEGPEKDSLLAKVKEKQLEDCILFIGRVSPDEIYSYYKASDLFVFASKSETQGMVLLEAMAGKCPVVAVQASGIDDVIINGYNGFKTKEEAHLWAEAVQSVIEHPEQLQKMSDQAYEFAGNYSIDVMAQKALQVYYRGICKCEVPGELSTKKIEA
ncbi:MAG: glycosyltransferase family 4 protein [Epulopiscium sp.]|nr:glycosyltransferase family 4 protein [Candidatus Epulonipiscium sp.]